MLLTKEKCSDVLDILERVYPDAKPELNFETPFTLLVAVILSAQCTDKRVNEVTSVLFKKYDKPEDFVNITQEELESYIKPCGFYHDKAKHIIGAACKICSDYGGKVPDKFEELVKLPGVGRKTANVVYAVAFGGDAIAVDTHVFRVSHRLNMSDAKDPEGTEKQLYRLIADGRRNRAHHLLIFHGRRCCKAQRPLCSDCPVKDYCTFGGKNE